MQPDDAARLQELQVVLSRFGTVVATRFEMGLSLCTTEKMIFKSKETQLDEEKNLKVQLLRLLHGTVKDPNVSLDTLHVYTRGGKSSILPGLDITSWLSTVQDPANWVVIGVSSVVSTLSFLDEPRKSAVQALLASISSSQVQRLVPVFHFPGRFTEWWTADGDRRTGTGYVDVPLSVRLSILRPYTHVS
ncbi:hypothetical protein BOTBODRAFT_599993 [Botryobasidium botryosum FD-172 SS1]|uniref:MACPF-like domain-containing protein n=1 Tax=Botryobasidium botryosum (strain FD-172 SS1) TaxID=930990 RepID=A0A067MNQ3_BOTB1|nr:hypothetical protein BOTBODRAFT_599993 [Botryobasidium botryosum FD-172 SS1]